MSCSTSPRVCTQPGAALYCKSATVRRGEVVQQGHVARWLRRPTPRPMGWHDAELVIDGTPYNAEATFILDDDTGHSFIMVDLRRYDGTHYRLTLGQGDEQCDCPHATYRGIRCKHVAGVVEALDMLDRLEQAERLLAEANDYLQQLEAIGPPPELELDVPDAVELDLSCPPMTAETW